MNLVISGYTAAGKTTHARLLADALGLEFISAAEMLLAGLGFDTARTSESEIWFSHNAEIDRRRRSSPIDEEVDRFLIERATRGDGAIFDARFLPWLSDASLTRVWLDSDLPSRARKCCVSVNEDAAAVPDCAGRVHEKDTLDVRRFADGHGLVFGPHRDVFDIILDNSLLIPEATRACADRGIERFQDYVLAAVEAVGGDKRRLNALRFEDREGFTEIVRFVRGVGP